MAELAIEPMKTALAVTHRGGPGRVVEAALEAERAGMHAVWLSEDIGDPGAFSLASAIAARTTSLEIGLGVLNPFTRHPFQIAMEAAALQELADGRLVLGLGSGNRDGITMGLELDYDYPLAKLLDSVALIQAVLGGETDYAGPHYSAHKPLTFELTTERPHIVLGVKSERAIIRSAPLADGLLLSLLSTPGYVSWVQEVSPVPLPLTAYALFSHDVDPGHAQDAIRPIVGQGLARQGDNELVLRSGLPEGVAAGYRQRLTEGRFDPSDVPREVAARFTVAGDLDECASRLADFAESGLDTLVIRTLPHADIGEVLSSLGDAISLANAGSTRKIQGPGARSPAA